MNALLEMVAVIVAAGGVLIGIMVVLSAGLRVGVAVLLDLLLAAGLLRLAAEPGWAQILTTALTVAIRHLITVGLTARAWQSPRHGSHNPAHRGTQSTT